MKCPRLKYCGLTRSADVLAAIELGADAIGINFVETSPRCVSEVTARELVSAMDGKALAVGVFVNESIDRVAEIVDSSGIQAIQLHGDEPTSWMINAGDHPLLATIPILRSIPWRGIQTDHALVQDWVNVGHRNLLAFLVDAFVPNQRGGTGHTVRWELLAPRPAVFGKVPILLAGGIKPDNVADAIRQARPDGIDVASGIETAPGIKDAEKMRAVAAVVKSALS
jgi:phosphoribosylanthranilate isomerase